MHRSGTSCLAGTLEQAGVYLGQVSNHNKYNKKGNKESFRIMSLNDEILKYNNASWDSPPENIEWTIEHEIEGKAIIKDFETNSHTQYWGFKDPRVLLTLPFWKRLLPHALYVGTFRAPYNVAQSLFKRKNASIDLNKGLSLWFSYNQCLINSHKETPFPLISFDLSEEKYQQVLETLRASLQLNKVETENFFDKKLRSNNTSKQQPTLPSEITTLHEKLKKISTLE